MRPVEQSRRRRHRPAGLLLPAIALLALAGCESGFGSARQTDPMLGIHAPPMPSPAGGGAATAQATATPTPPPPPLPASMSVPNQAALASGTTPTPDDPRSLRITTPVVPVSSPGAARGASPGGVLEGPVPIPESTSRTMTAPPPPPSRTPPTSGSAIPPPPGASMTFDQAQQFLKQRGVVWQRLETRGDTGEWAFQCSLPLPGNKNINRTYETQAPLPRDPLSAVRAVIEAMEKDQR